MITYGTRAGIRVFVEHSWTIPPLASEGQGRRCMQMASSILKATPPLREAAVAEPTPATIDGFGPAYVLYINTSKFVKLRFFGQDQ